MTSFTRWVLGHRLVVVLAWVIIAVAAFASVGPAVDALSDEFELPGRESSEAVPRSGSIPPPCPTCKFYECVKPTFSVSKRTSIGSK